MAKTIITQAGLDYIASTVAAAQKITFDTFKFANVTGIDGDTTPLLSDTIDSGDVVHSSSLNGVRLLAADDLCIDCVLTSGVGDFSFNVVGLYAGTTLVMLSYQDLQEKTASDPDTATVGNTIIKKFILHIAEAATVADITYTPEDWSLSATIVDEAAAVGAFSWWFGPVGTIPDGWAEANGGVLAIADYPDYFDVVGHIYTPDSVDNTTYFSKPDLRGVFIRGLDNGAGIDADRALGTPQSASVDEHYHAVGTIHATRDDGTFISRAFTLARNYVGRLITGDSGSPSATTVNAGDYTESTTGLATSDVINGAGEMRPINFAAVPIVKIAHSKAYDVAIAGANAKSLGGFEASYFLPKGDYLRDKVAIFVDRKTQGTAGGDFTTGAWRNRDLNTEIINEFGATFDDSTGVVTLEPGKYLIEWSCPAFRVDGHVSALRVEDDSDYKTGESSVANSGTPVTSVSSGKYLLEITESKWIIILHQCSSSFASYGFGQASGVAEETYSTLKITKIGGGL